MLICPDEILPSAMPFRLASRASFSAPSATRSRWSPSSACAAGCVSISSPSAVKIAAGCCTSSSKRRARSGKARSLPARSVDTTNMAALLSASVMREHRHINVPPMPAPKPRSRSSRGAPPCGNVAASREICAAAAWRGPKRNAATAAGEVASKIDAPVGLAHRIFLPSALQSQTGAGLSACDANRGSRRYSNWKLDFVITVSQKLRLIEP